MNRAAFALSAMGAPSRVQANGLFAPCALRSEVLGQQRGDWQAGQTQKASKRTASAPPCALRGEVWDSSPATGKPVKLRRRRSERRVPSAGGYIPPTLMSCVFFSPGCSVMRSAVASSCCRNAGSVWAPGGRS